MPTLIIRNIIGFRELINENDKGFSLTPSLPDSLFIQGRKYGLSNINFQDLNFSVFYIIEESNNINLEIKFLETINENMIIRDGKGNEPSLSKEIDKIKLKTKNFQTINFYL